MSTEKPQRQLEPPDLPMVPFAVTGMLIFLMTGVIAQLNRASLAAHGHENWISICFAGFLVGFPGLAWMIVHDAHRRRRRAGVASSRSAGRGRPQNQA